MTTTTQAYEDQKRADYTTGLRALADALDANPALPLPYAGSDLSQMSVFTKTKEEVAAYARLMGKAQKNVTDSAAYGFELTGALHGLRLIVFAPRDEVCTRTVVGTREVTTTVPDPSVTVPMVTVTETVEEVRWDCHPILAPVSA